MKSNINSFLIGITAAIVLLFFFRECSPSQPQLQRQLTKEDTIQKNKPARVIEAGQPLQPQKVFVYVRDTIWRNRSEKADIITGVKFKDNRVMIQRITPDALPLENSYIVPVSLPSMEIDQAGNLAFNDKKEKRKKFWRKVGTGLAVGGAFVAGAKAGYELSK